MESLPSRDDSVVGSSSSLHITTFDDSNKQANGQNKNSQKDKAKYKPHKIEVCRESILSLLSQKMRLVDAAKQLGVSRSTMKRKLKDFGIKWQSSRQRQEVKNKKHNTKSPYAQKNFSLPNLVGDPDVAGHGLRGGNVAGPTHPTLSDHVPSSCNVVQCPSPESLYPLEGHRHVEEHLNCVKECTLLSTEQLSGSSKMFTVKATYNDDTVKFKFSSSSSFEQLEEEVGKRLKLKVGTFKLKYLDEENDWILMTSLSDLLDALSASTSSGSNAARLSVEVLTTGIVPDISHFEK